MGLLWAAGPAPQLLYPFDTAAYLDACHRAATGQWLGRDFGSPIGPAAILPTVLAMKVGGATVHALAGASVLIWLSYALITWFAVRRRISAWLAGAFALFTAGIAAAPYTLDFGHWRSLSYGMSYNRLAWASLGIAAAIVMLPRRDGAAARWVPAALSAIAVWLWAIKPNYLAILAPLAFYNYLGQTNRRAWFARSIIGALSLLLLLWICVPFSIPGYIAIHFGMAREAPPDLLRYTFFRSLQENLVPVLGVLAAWTCALLSANLRDSRRLALLVAALIGATFVTNLANCQFSEIPLWGALGWLAAATAGPRARMGLVVGLVCGIAYIWQPLASIAYNYAWKHYRAPGAPPALEVAGVAWQGMPMRPAPGMAPNPAASLEGPANFAAWLNEGLVLLAGHHPTPGYVLCLDWTNPFPFATGTAPAPGDDVAWHVGRTHGPHNHPDISRLLASAAVIMEPIRSIQPDSLEFKRRLFAPGLATSFRLAGESPQWRIWLRQDALPAVPGPRF